MIGGQVQAPADAPDARAWYDERGLVRQLPWGYRAYAAYSRAVVDRPSRFVRGGLALLLLQNALVRRLPVAKVARVETGSSTVFVDLTDARVTLVLDELLHDSHEARVMRDLIHPGDTVLDVGANHGTFAVLASRLVGREGRVHAIEPQPRLAPLIRRSLEATGASPFQVHEVACAESEGFAMFFVPRHSSGSAGVFKGFSGARRHRRLVVRTARLDEILDVDPGSGRVFVKLDVEGSELPTMRGAERLIRDHLPAIMLEINPTTARASGHSADDLIDTLEGYGYSEYAELERYPERALLASLTGGRQRNIVVLPPGPRP
jgi:FkbM family methyltransferase